VDGLVVLFGLGLVAAIIGVPIAAFVALSRTGRLQRALTELERQVQRLRDAQALQLRLEAPQNRRRPPQRLGPRPLFHRSRSCQMRCRRRPRPDQRPQSRNRQSRR
jgi:hypothetical protein